MRDREEAVFLRAIGEENDDATGRLVFADWLAEHGDSARSEFVRIQCELASPEIAEKASIGLRMRERQLLDAYRRKWILAFGLPLEDVSFGRGLIAGARVPQWSGGKLLDEVCMAQLATLEELDLSGLGMGDAGLTAFAEKARFPALRTLILSDNGITNAGVGALAKASGLPRLASVYLFQNAITDGTRAIAELENASHLTIASLDLGERAQGYCMSPGEVEVARRAYLRASLLPIVSEYFQKYKRLQSAVLCVAQYWADEADDAVHGTLIVSELPEPILEGVGWGDDASKSDSNVPNTRIMSEYGESPSVISLFHRNWDDNSGAIPLWAAFAPEGGHQDYTNLQDVYAPAVMFYRHGGYEILHKRRPHLDGIRPEWWEE